MAVVINYLINCIVAGALQYYSRVQVGANFYAFGLANEKMASRPFAIATGKCMAYLKQ